jgi:hypothetical protein
MVWAVTNFPSPSESPAMPLVSTLVSRLLAGLEPAQMLGVGWISLALLLTFCSSKLAIYVVSRRP